MDESIPIIRNGKVRKLSSTLELMKAYPSITTKEIAESFYIAFDETQIKDLIKSLKELIKKEDE